MINKKSLNVLGGTLASCCFSPLTGFARTGFCDKDHRDKAEHTVCVKITQKFLDISFLLGNDLITERPNMRNLQEGDYWCVCIKRWIQVIDTGYMAKVKLEACHIAVLDYISLEELKKYEL